MTVVMPDWETILPIWERLMFLPDTDKNKNINAYGH